MVEWEARNRAVGLVGVSCLTEATVSSLTGDNGLTGAHLLLFFCCYCRDFQVPRCAPLPEVLEWMRC